MSVKEPTGSSTIRRDAPVPSPPPGLSGEELYGWYNQMRLLGYNVPDPRKKVAADKKKAAADKASTTSQAQADIGYIWVNGHRMVVTGKNPDGSLMVQVEGIDKKSSAFGSDATLAFGALDSPTPSADTRYLMSVGPQMDQEGNVAKPTLLGHGAQASVDGVTPTRMTQNPVGQNKFTIGLGVQWLAELSTKDPEAYQAKVDLLHRAGYLSDADYAAAGGGWSNAVGGAFALAARDTAVTNGTKEGANTTLEQLLDAKAKAGDEKKKKSFTPVDRSYTDPAAVRGQARSAAEAALGRRLTPDEEARLTSHFHGLEAGMYDQIDAAHRNETGAVVTQPNLPGQVDDFLYNGQLAQEEADFRAGGYGDVIRKMVGL